MTTSYIFLATGFEEIEALTTVDIMRRAGMHVLTVSIEDTPQVAGAHGIPVVADTCISDIDFSQAEWLILPGGMPGATNLAACAPLCDALKAHAAKGGKIAAICASPAVVLAPLGLLAKKRRHVLSRLRGRMLHPRSHPPRHARNSPSDTCHRQRPCRLHGFRPLHRGQHPRRSPRPGNRPGPPFLQENDEFLFLTLIPTNRTRRRAISTCSPHYMFFYEKSK